MNKRLFCYIAAVIMAVSAFGCNNLKQTTDKKDVSVSKEISDITTESTENITEATTISLEAEKQETEDIQQGTDHIIDFESFKQELYILGDSIAYGYGSYERLPAIHVLAQQGVNLSTALETVFLYENGEGYAVEIISEMQPKYLMISMGMNEIGNRKYETFAEKYRGIIDEIQAVSPKTIIFVAGLTPVCIDAENKNIDNENISNHNEVLEKEFSDIDNVYYVNPGEALMGADGAMNSEYSGGDGIHLSGVAYDLLLERLAEIVFEELKIIE